MTKELTPVTKYTERIQISWHKTVDSILQTGRLCAEANSSLSPSQKKQLFARLPFGESTFSKLAKIGVQSRLQEDPVRQLLPPNFTIIYEVTQFSDEQLKSAVDEGVLSPESSRAVLERWRKGPITKPAVPKENRTFAFIQLPIDYPEDRTEALQAELERMRETFHVHVARPRTAEEKAHDQYFARLHRFIISEARRRVQQLKNSKLAGKPHLNKAQKKSLWGFAEDETRIDSNYTWEQVQHVLDFIGLEGEFNRIQEQALRFVSPPDTPPFDEKAQSVAEMVELVKQLKPKYDKSNFADWT